MNMKKALVIGASSGIGLEVARLLAADGYHVGISGRREKLLEELKSENPENYSVFTFDVTALNNSFELNTISEQMGQIELIVHCAGHGEINKELEFEIENDTNKLNVLAFTEVVGWAYNYFKKAGGGQLAVITSIAGIRGGRVAPAYNASKAYQISYLEALRQKAKRKKIPMTITDIRPGFVDTKMAKGGGKFWVVPVKKAARQIYADIKARKDVGYVSRRWVLIALLLKFIPRWIYKRM